MITSKIKTRHWFLFILIAVGLVLSLIGLALFKGEQYQVVPEEFRLVFYLSVFGSIIFYYFVDNRDNVPAKVEKITKT